MRMMKPLARELAAAIVVTLAAPRMPALAELQPFMPRYCVPGITAERCRGVFWETGKLYRKVEGTLPLSRAEYEAGVQALASLRGALGATRDERVGEAASQARAELRRTGGGLCRALEADLRYELELQLNEVLAALDDVDVVALQQKAQPAIVAPGFGQARLLLDSALVLFDKFLGDLPPTLD